MDECKGQVFFMGDNLDNRADLEGVFLEISRLTGMPIEVSNPHGRGEPRPYDGNDQIHVYFWSSAVDYDAGRSGHQMNSPIFGSSLTGCARDGARASNHRDVIKLKSPEGQTVAEVHKDRLNSLHILYDLPHQNYPEGRDDGGLITQLKGIMRLYLETVNFCSLEDKKSFVSSLINSRRALINHRQNLKDKINTIAWNIAGNSQAELDLGHKIKSLDYALREMPLKQNHDGEIEKLRAENKVIVTDGKLTVFNGDFSNQRIIFDINSGLYEVVISGENVPFHKICRGPAKAGLAQIIGKNQYYNATKIIKRWLRSEKQS